EDVRVANLGVVVVLGVGCEMGTAVDGGLPSRFRGRQAALGVHQFAAEQRCVGCITHVQTAGANPFRGPHHVVADLLQLWCCHGLFVRDVCQKFVFDEI